ncbi:hypothetical protein [Spongiactinospora sp. 9N601]|uniref:hypothetical protein n=1 Tax=Spongiactinospora sp. 9N601 TaxID=3375149 RepID=UPI003792CD02
MSHEKKPSSADRGRDDDRIPDNEREPANVPLADRRRDPELHDVPDFGEEMTPSATDPAGQPRRDPHKKRVHGESEGYEPPTRG